VNKTIPQALRDKLRKVLDRRPLRVIPQREDLARAAVLVPLCIKDGRCHVILIRRASNLPHHAGEISFPGGRVEPQDPSLEETALREACEEVGLDPRDVEVVGRLDEIVTRSRFLITPFVGVIPYPYPLRPDGQEATEVLLLPMEYFHVDRAKVEIWQEGERLERVYFYHCGPWTVWGATAKILKGLFEIVSCGRGP